MGFNTVGFYVDWALLEGTEGVYKADGVFAYEPFFEAATKAGIYLIAVSTKPVVNLIILTLLKRLGPHINGE